MHRIQEFSLKIKNLAEDVLSEWGVILLVFFLALASFGLGRLSALESIRPPVQVREAGVESAVRAIPLGGQVVASKSGSAYYFPWCGGAAHIAEKNRVWFASEAAARKAGYAPAKNCKGLVNSEQK